MIMEGYIFNLFKKKVIMDGSKREKEPFKGLGLNFFCFSLIIFKKDSDFIYFLTVGLSYFLKI